MPKGDPFYMQARFNGWCAHCNRGINASDQVVFAPNGRRVFCTKQGGGKGCGDNIMAGLVAQPKPKGSSDG